MLCARSAPAEIPQVLFTLKTASSLDSAGPWDTLKTRMFSLPTFPNRQSCHVLNYTHGHTRSSALNVTVNFSVSLLLHLLCFLPIMPFLPTGLLASTCSMSPLLAFPDTHPDQVPTEFTHCAVISCFHILHQTGLLCSPRKCLHLLYLVRAQHRAKAHMGL